MNSFGIALNNKQQITAHRIFNSGPVFTFRARLIQFTEIFTAEVYLFRKLQ
jgi:hypothetical protein